MEVEEVTGTTLEGFELLCDVTGEIIDEEELIMLDYEVYNKPYYFIIDAIQFEERGKGRRR